MQPSITDPRLAVAQRAVTVLGSNNPQMNPGSVPFWLGTIGNGENFKGLGRWNVDKDYPAGRLCGRELVAVVDSDVPPSLRALAARALGMSKQKHVFEAAQRWVEDPVPVVRQALEEPTPLGVNEGSVQSKGLFFICSAGQRSGFPMSIDIAFRPNTGPTTTASVVAEPLPMSTAFEAMVILPDRSMDTAPTTPSPEVP